MPAVEFNTTELNLLILEMRNGSEDARNQLVRRMQERLERLARRMLRTYPGVVRWEDTADVMQNAFMRLLKALESVSPANTAALFGLATEVIRRELIDLTRHYQGPHGWGKNHKSGVLHPGSGLDSKLGYEPEAEDPSRDDLERWRIFHEEVANLPAEQREVFGLMYYHGWTHDQIAELFQRNPRTIRRHWQLACRTLKDRLGGQWKDPD